MTSGASDAGAAATHAPVPCSSPPGLLTEGPRWNAEGDELLWVDIVGSRLHRAHLTAGGQLDQAPVLQFDRHVGAAAPVAGGGYVVAAESGFLFADSSGVVAELAQPESGRGAVRFNDGACDPQGRFWAGTMAYDETPEMGVLYRLELDGTCSTVLTGLTISNGIGWSPDGATMYLADSGTATVDAFSFDADGGTIGDRRTIVRIAADDGVPDGLTVDGEGNIWVALWGGGALRRYAPDGTLLSVLVVPAERPTSCAFGGRDGSTLFITTSREGLDDAVLALQPDAGRVFRVERLGACGPPCTPYRGVIS
jgi:sugar lactone lactonase YvrE